jgi:hypothetical protein
VLGKDRSTLLLIANMFWNAGRSEGKAGTGVRQSLALIQSPHLCTRSANAQHCQVQNININTFLELNFASLPQILNVNRRPAALFNKKERFMTKYKNTHAANIVKRSEFCFYCKKYKTIFSAWNKSI